MSRILLLLLCMGLQFSWAQQSRSTYWLQKNDRGNRYEGSYTRQVNNYNIKLVSLVAGAIPNYQFRQNQQLKVRFYCPESQSYQLRAEERIATKYYWMQAKKTRATMGWNTFTPWPVDVVLKELNVRSQNLGVVVELGRVGSGRFVPSQVYQNAYTGSARRYTAHIQVGFGVAKGNCKVYRGQRVTGSPLVERKISEKSGGDTFPILISASSLPASGWYTVQINLRESRRLDLKTHSFTFYHKKG